MDSSAQGAGAPAGVHRRGFLGGVLAVCGSCLVAACGSAGSAGPPTADAAATSASVATRPSRSTSSAGGRTPNPSTKATREGSPDRAPTREPQPSASPPSSEPTSDPTSDPTNHPSPTSDPTTNEPKPTKTPSPTPTDPSIGALLRTNEVPVGGGVVLSTYNVVVTQPTAGDFRAFGAHCTHQGCLLGPVSAGEIRCPCHSSRFSILDGTALFGPAPTALPPVAITVAHGYVYPN